MKGEDGDMLTLKDKDGDITFMTDDAFKEVFTDSLQTRLFEGFEPPGNLQKIEEDPVIPSKIVENVRAALMDTDSAMKIIRCMNSGEELESNYEGYDLTNNQLYELVTNAIGKLEDAQEAIEELPDPNQPYYNPDQMWLFN